MSSSVSRSSSDWPAVRRRFILYGVLATVWTVGVGAAFGFYFGGLGLGDALVPGGFLLVACAVALYVAYTSLRRKYLGGT